jgi:thiamine pyrophosphokinase
MKIVIFANGQMDDMKFAGGIAKGADFVICCDGGSKYAAVLGIRPDLIVGDLDSIDGDTLEKFQAMDVAFEKFPVAKDFTDLELSIDLALAKKPDEIVILGGFGGRADHFLGNIHALVPAAKAGVPAFLLDAGCRAFVICGTVELVREDYDVVSLIPLTTEVLGVCTAGLEYALENETLRIGTTRGISNKFVSDVAEVSVCEGLLLVICAKAD